MGKAGADAKGNCILLRLEGVELDLQEFAGTVSDWIGITDKARALILEKGGEVLAENPICPELAGLDPNFSSGGIREIGEGGIGAALSGSVDTSSTTLLELVALLQDKRGLGIIK
ncbi:hypothetical protein [Ruegeria sp. Ofav3-42]|uniref:hypothetical protein n=1 Tax=Ruegeria sp. Ofav3-42 TaxID=2917759 RepID=UPI001EF7244D|nr:hypothetical protein [Ruegeria sp. Ofav3-42]MCG7522091.1 hypothetical protein [Ruegeria sp. Ofav3-42]